MYDIYERIDFRTIPMKVTGSWDEKNKIFHLENVYLDTGRGEEDEDIKITRLILAINMSTFKDIESQTTYQIRQRIEDKEHKIY